MITPRTAPGTLELLPREQMVFQHMLDVIRRGYERFRLCAGRNAGVRAERRAADQIRRRNREAGLFRAIDRRRCSKAMTPIWPCVLI